MLQIDNLRKAYGHNAPVIDDLSLTVAAGEFVSLLGSSGCGKSTLLKMIAGLTSLTDGSIEIDAKTLDRGCGRVSFVFQDATLLPWRTVAGNIALALEFERVPTAARAARIANVLQLVGLLEVRDFYPRELSGGMKMRVSIARALVSKPQLLLMDEPFGALDEMTRNRLNEDLLALDERQRSTTLFVTHSVSEAVFLSDRIILMGANPGRVVAEIVVPFRKPRTAELRGQTAFATLVAQVSRALAATLS